MKEIKLNCPCCKASLIIDPETGGVIKHTKFKEAPQSLDAFIKSEKGKGAKKKEKFKEARDKEESKMDLLEKKFEWAKKNKDKLPDAPKPDIFWD
ncbi:MAG: hypothetical protein HQK83_00445 [Fibrobacteria bacterium]|nr:hypothetical protein [Fibrobacteria bacterium]